MSTFQEGPGILPRATTESLDLVRKNVPLELQKLEAWVCGDRSPKTDKKGKVKSSKAPIDPHTGSLAKSNDPSTWGTLDQAIEHALKNDLCFGVGINLAGSEYLGLDLDHVIDPVTGELNPKAKELIERLPPSYIEVSPSGCGLRLFYRGVKPAALLGRSVIKDAFGEGTALEVYDQSAGRYLTTTGRTWTEQPLPIATVDDASLQALVDFLPAKAKSKPKPPKAETVTKPTSKPVASDAHVSDNDLERARWGLLVAKVLDPDAGYPQWLRVGVALKALGEPGLDLWDEWSLSSTDYNFHEINAKWPGLRGSSINSLFGMFDDADPTWRDRYRQHKAIEGFSEIPVAAAGLSDSTNGHAHGQRPLGERDPTIGRLVFSPKITLPTAQAFVREFHTQSGVRTLHSYAGQLWVWKDNRYVEVEEESLKHHLHAWLHGALTRKGVELVPFEANPTTVNAVLQTVRSYAHLPASTTTPSWLVEQSMPPADEILPCKTMSLHIPTGQVLQPTPVLFNTNALDFDFDPAAAAPARWHKFLDELFGNDTESINLLQEWFGYSLVADTSQQKILLMVGPRRSGKGTIARVLAKLVGSSNVCGPTVGSLGGNFGLQPLLGKSLALVSDARFAGDNIGVIVERLLSISGEDAISVDRKFLTSVTMKLAVRFMFLTNELPRFNDASTALAGRFLILQLRHSFYGRENVDLTDQLLEELQGILLWALEGWKRLHERGRFQAPDSSSTAVQDIEDLSSPVHAFVNEMCQVGPGHRVPVSEIYDAWRVWCCKDGRRHATTRNVFGRDLQAAVPSIVRRRGTKQDRFYEGIELVKDMEVES